jgi:adenylate cyclase
MGDGSAELLRQALDSPDAEGDWERLRAALLRGGDPALASRVCALLGNYGVLLELANALGGELSLDVLLPRLIDLVTRTLKADRATLFLHDAEAGQLYSRVMRGGQVQEIRIPAEAGIAGAAFGSGQTLNIADCYADARFNPEVDRRTGYRTNNMLCAPLRNRAGAAIGVTQVLNKADGPFTAADEALLATVTAHAAAALEHAQLFEKLERARREEAHTLDLMATISSDLNIETLLAKIIEGTTALLEAERGTLFLHDARANELWSLVAEGAGTREIRIPSNAGIAGWAFTSGEVVNIPDAYADPRFNQAVDRATGFRTRNILAMPVVNKTARIVGVVQVLNKAGGPFTLDDERRLRSFVAQVVAALENAQLFEEVLQLKNYNEGILKSLTNGVVTLDVDGRIEKVNEAGARILATAENDLVGQTAATVFANSNPWIVKSLSFVAQTGKTDFHADVDLRRRDGQTISVNLNVAQLLSIDDKPSGAMLVLEDITREKRVRTTMARYMAKEVVDKLLEQGGEDALSGSSQEATVLFSDIRRFTTIAERLGTRMTVTLLNEYFTEMVEVIFASGGILDKYIGDAIMAVFGAPMQNPFDADNALKAANEMLRALRRVNERRAAEGKEQFEIGVGLSTGEVMAGNIGSVKRMEYTVIGDTVNLAARLESATKHYGATILLSEATVARLASRADLREIDLVRTKGFSRPALIYEATAHFPDPVRAQLARAAPVYQEGFTHYRRRRWDEAIACFEESLKRKPGDGPAQLHLDRCRYYRENPPIETWDGVWTMTEK